MYHFKAKCGKCFGYENGRNVSAMNMWEMFRKMREMFEIRKCGKRVSDMYN
jgi:hypothetical protein